MNEQIKQRINQLNNGEVPIGYEKTEIGTFPVGWKTTTLDKLLEFKNGVNADKEKYNSGVKMISVMDILTDSPIYYDKIKGQVDIDEKTLDTYSVTYGDILFQRSSETFEDAGKSNVYLDKDRTATYSGFVIRGKKKADYNPYFLNEVLRIGQVRNQIIRNAAGSQHINVGQDSLAKIIVPLASDVEQSNIAEILMKWDEAIELQEQYIECCTKIKKGFFKKLFSFDEGTSSYVRLGDAVVSMASGGTPLTSKSEYFDGDIVWVSIDDITKCDKYITDSARKLTVAGIDNSSAKLFPAGTILYAMYASIGKCAIADVECSSSQAILGIVPNADILDTQYLYYYLCSIQESIALQGQQGTQSNLNKKMVESFQIPVPTNECGVDLQKQKYIASVLINMDEVISMHKTKQEKLKKQRKTLQQYLLNGIVRVK